MKADELATKRDGTPKYDAEIVMVQGEEDLGDKLTRKWKITNIEYGLHDPIPFDHKGTEPLIIKAAIGRTLIKRVYVDNGSAINVMYGHCLKGLPLDIQRYLKSAMTALVGFAG